MLLEAGILAALSDCSTLTRQGSKQLVPSADMVPGFGDTALPGPGVHAAAGVHHGQLAHVGLCIGGDQGLDDLRRRHPLAQHGQAQGAEANVGQRLRRDGADAGQRPGNDLADGQVVRLARPRPTLSVSGSRAMML